MLTLAVGFLLVVVFRFRFGGSRDVRSFLSTSAEPNPPPRGLDDEARGASDSESSAMTVSVVRREVRRFCFGSGGEGERSRSLSLASGPTDTLADALESERVVVNGKGCGFFGETDGYFPLDLALRLCEAGGDGKLPTSGERRGTGGAGANSASSSDSAGSLSNATHGHWCFGCLGEPSFSSSSSLSTLVSWEDTALSLSPDERTAGESEIGMSLSTSVPNDLSGDSSEGGASTRFEPYVRVTRFFVESMGGDKGGDEEVGGAVLGESFREVIRNDPL